MHSYEKCVVVQENERVKHIECTFWRLFRQQVRWTGGSEFTMFGKQSANKRTALTTATLDHPIYLIENVSRSQHDSVWSFYSARSRSTGFLTVAKRDRKPWTPSIDRYAAHFRCYFFLLSDILNGSTCDIVSNWLQFLFTVSEQDFLVYLTRILHLIRIDNKKPLRVGRWLLIITHCFTRISFDFSFFRLFFSLNLNFFSFGITDNQFFLPQIPDFFPLPFAVYLLFYHNFFLFFSFLQIKFTNCTFEKKNHWFIFTLRHTGCRLVT